MSENELTKYPRTPHLPSSPGATSDDKWASNETLAYLASGIELVVTEKMDGGNLSFTHNHFFGRSLDSGTHAWDQQAKALWAQIHFDIPDGWRVSGESMYARRSVAYENLPGVYIMFGLWDEQNVARPWAEVEEWAQLLELPTPRVLYRGTDFQAATRAWGEQLDDEVSEGFVVRDAGAFPYAEFDRHVCKWVRSSHVRTRDDWRHRDDFALNTFVS
jgi:hypothetical protein